MISLILPTYNEAESIEEVLKRASDALRATGEKFELIVVDDSSSDGTACLAEGLAAQLPVQVISRPGRSGLALAVVDGWNAARGDVFGVMDADLQHPPEVLTRLVAAMRNPHCGVAVASRSGPGGGSADWPWKRRLTSWLATHLAACVLPWTLADVRDPMSGMFLVRRRALEGVHLAPTGYKILLEVLAKARYQEFTEVPYMFGPRDRGSSKLGTRQSLEYLLHLARLARSTGQLSTWMRYAAVGLSGALLDVGLCVILAQRLGWPVALALAVAIQSALLSNFLWNKILTFRGLRATPAHPRFRTAGIQVGASSVSGRSAGTPIPAHFLQFEEVCLPGAVLNAVVTLLLHWQGVPLLRSCSAGVAVGGAWNLTFNVPSIWRTWGSRPSPREEPVQTPEGVKNSPGTDP